MDGLVARIGSAGRGRAGRASGSEAGAALALGAFLDGIPEQMVLGIGIAAGRGWASDCWWRSSSPTCPRRLEQHELNQRLQYPNITTAIICRQHHGTDEGADHHQPAPTATT